MRSYFATLFFLAAGSLIGQQTYQFTTYTIPGASLTNSGVINNAGDVAGSFATLNADGSYLYSGYLRSADGVFTLIQPPDTGGNVFVGGINNKGLIAGSYEDDVNTVEGFLYANGSYTAVSPDGKQTQISGLNDLNSYVGFYGTPWEPFVSTPGGVRTLDYPGAAVTSPIGINDRGIIVGTYLDGFYELNHGFLLEGSSYTALDYPGAYQTFASSINSGGIIVGDFYVYANASRGFVYRNGVFSEVSIPGASNTYLSGINDHGVINGTYTTSDNRQVAFIATPVGN